MHPDLDITVFLSHFGAFLTSLLTFAQQRISESIWCKLQILVDNLQKQVTCSKLIIHSSKASIYVNETASVIKMRSLDTILMNKIVNWLCHVSIMTLYSILSVFSNAKKVRTQWHYLKVLKTALCTFCIAVYSKITVMYTKHEILWPDIMLDYCPILYIPVLPTKFLTD